MAALLHRRSFEAVFGPKEDRWLMYTVAGLLTCIGYAQVRAGTPEDWAHARRLGVGTASTLLLIDVVNVPRGRIKPTYLIDAAGEAVLIAGWALVSRRSNAAQVHHHSKTKQQQDRRDGTGTSERGATARALRRGSPPVQNPATRDAGSITDPP